MACGRLLCLKDGSPVGDRHRTISPCTRIRCPVACVVLVYGWEYGERFYEWNAHTYSWEKCVTSTLIYLHNRAAAIKEIIARGHWDCAGQHNLIPVRRRSVSGGCCPRSYEPCKWMLIAGQYAAERTADDILIYADRYKTSIENLTIWE